MRNTGTDRRLSNYVRVHRRRAGLTQAELGNVLGLPDDRTVSRHEAFLFTPSLELAIGYEIIFRVPVSELFAGLRDDVAAEVEKRLLELEEKCGQGNARGRHASAIARKLIWLTERRSVGDGVE